MSGSFSTVVKGSVECPNQPLPEQTGGEWNDDNACPT